MVRTLRGGTCSVMEDGLTLVLVIALCLVLKPLISAILRGIGSSEHRRDRWGRDGPIGRHIDFMVGYGLMTRPAILLSATGLRNRFHTFA